VRRHFEQEFDERIDPNGQHDQEQGGGHEDRYVHVVNGTPAAFRFPVIVDPNFVPRHVLAST
jgi:hypothetical protein